MNYARAKGMRTELKCQKELEEEGWLVQRAPPPNRFSKQTDIYGLWDIFGLKTYSDSTVSIRFIQVKTNSKPKLEPFKEFKEKFPGTICEIWCFWERGKRKKIKGWEKIIL